MLNARFIPEDQSLEIEFESQNLIEPTTDRSLKNIKKTLMYSLRKEYGINDVDHLNEAADSLLKIHGLHKDNFDFVKQAGTAINERINEFSIDDNSNKNEKNPKSIIYEVTSPVHKLIGYDYLYQIMRELYSKKEAKRLSGLMYDYTLALADSVNIMLPYCWSLDASKIITEGKLFGQLESSPTKRIDSYISVENEIVHTLSNNLAGAIAIGTFFLDIAHLGIYKDNIAYESLKKDKELRKHISNQFQKIVHGFNSLSRNGGVESPFTNISVLDRSKLRTVLNDENGYFDILFYADKKIPESKDRATWKEFVIEYIVELQTIYMDYFDKGDPRTDGMPYRFPVTTLNLGKVRNTKTQEWEVEDKEFLKLCCKKDIFRYNIFVSEGTKFASCCFIGNEEITVIEEERTYKISIKAFVNKFFKEGFGEKKLENKYQIYSVNPKTLESELCYITGVLKKPNNTKKLIKVKIEGKENEVTEDHVFLVKHKRTSEIREITAGELVLNYKDYLIPVEVTE